MNDIDHHGTPPRRIPTNEYYRTQWRSSCMAAILSAALCFAAAALCVVAAMYGYPKTAIWLGVAAAFLAFRAWLRFSESGHYQTLYMRSLINPTKPTE